MSRALTALLAVSTGAIIANVYYLQPLLADIATEFGLSVPAVGAVAMLMQIGTATGMLLFVPLGDKYDRRSLIVTLLGGCTVALALAAVAPTVTWLCVACFVVGATTAVVHVILPLAAHLAPAHQRGHVVGTVLGGLLVGILLARSFGGVFGARFGWRPVYWIAAGLMLALAVVLRAALPPSRPETSLPWTTLMRSIGQLAREHAAIREAAVIAWCLFLSFSALWTTLVFLLRTPPYHYGTSAAGTFGLLGAASAGAAPIVGKLSDRYGSERTVVIAIAATLAAYVVLWVGGRTLPGLILGIVLLDAGVQSGHVANQSRIYGLVPTARSRLNTLYMVSFMTGGAVGSYVGPLGFKLWGWTGFCAFPIAALTASLVYLRRSSRRPA